jgi:hypothetical protein
VRDIGTHDIVFDRKQRQSLTVHSEVHLPAARGAHRWSVNTNLETTVPRNGRDLPRRGHLQIHLARRDLRVRLSAVLAR